MAKKNIQLAKKTKANTAMVALNKKIAKEQDAAKKADEKKRADVKKVKVKALTNLCGKYLIPYSADQEFLIDEKQAEELVKNNDAAYVQDTV